MIHTPYLKAYLRKENVRVNSLRPTLWRTCRIIAGETRLQCLWNLFEKGELCVTEISDATGISPQNATTQLRALNSRGLITFRRQSMMVIYRAEANQAIDNAPELLQVLKESWERSMSFETIIRMATALTHERRIEVIRALNESRKTFSELLNSTSMTASALARHLKKLEKRGFVKKTDKRYAIAHPGNSLGRTLLKIARG